MRKIFGATYGGGGDGAVGGAGGKRGGGGTASPGGASVAVGAAGLGGGGASIDVCPGDVGGAGGAGVAGGGGGGAVVGGGGVAGTGGGGGSIDGGLGGGLGGEGGIGGGDGSDGGGGGMIGFSISHCSHSASGFLRQSRNRRHPYQSFSSYAPSYAPRQLTKSLQSFSHTYHIGTGSSTVQPSPTTGTAQNVPCSNLPALYRAYLASGSGSVECDSPIRSNRKFDICGSLNVNTDAFDELSASTSGGATPSPSAPRRLPRLATPPAKFRQLRVRRRDDGHQRAEREVVRDGARVEYFAETHDEEEDERERGTGESASGAAAARRRGDEDERVLREDPGEERERGGPAMEPAVAGHLGEGDEERNGHQEVHRGLGTGGVMGWVARQRRRAGRDGDEESRLRGGARRRGGLVRRAPASSPIGPSLAGR